MFEFEELSFPECVQHVMTERPPILKRFLLVAAILSGSHVLGQSSAQTKTPDGAEAARKDRVTLIPPTAVSANARIELNLRGGDYEVRPSRTGNLDVIEMRDPQASQRQTTLHFEQRNNRARLKVDPPTGDRSSHVIVELPRCADLSIHLTAGELVFTAPPCLHTDLNLHAGELVAHLGPASDYATIHASTTIGEVNAEQLGQTKDGFFNSVNTKGAGQNAFAAHVFTGQITIKN